MVPKWFSRWGRKSLKSLTSASTGDADAIAQFPLALLVVLAFIKRIISAPVMRSIVKARQARKNVEVWVRVNCFFFTLNLLIVSSSVRSLLLFSLSQLTGAP